MLSFTAPTWQPTQTAELARATREKRKPAASAILPGRLFLADFLTASDVATLRRLKVTHILSVLESSTPTLPKDLAPTVQTLHVNVADTPEADLLGHLPETTEWITRALEDKSAVVLVHCMMGVSRSATVISAYLMASERLSAADAVARVRAIRGIVRPNAGFARQLEAYAAMLDVQPSKVDVGPPPQSSARTPGLARWILRTVRRQPRRTPPITAAVATDQLLMESTSTQQQQGKLTHAPPPINDSSVTE